MSKIIKSYLKIFINFYIIVLVLVCCKNKDIKKDNHIQIKQNNTTNNSKYKIDNVIFGYKKGDNIKLYELSLKGTTSNLASFTTNSFDKIRSQKKINYSNMNINYLNIAFKLLDYVPTQIIDFKDTMTSLYCDTKQSNYIIYFSFTNYHRLDSEPYWKIKEYYFDLNIISKETNINIFKNEINSILNDLEC